MALSDRSESVNGDSGYRQNKEQIRNPHARAEDTYNIDFGVYVTLNIFIDQNIIFHIEINGILGLEFS
jgi:hypothetical protein